VASIITMPIGHRIKAALLVVVSTVALLLAPSAAFAQSDVGKFELTPYGGYRFGGTFEDEETSTSVELDDHASMGLILNVRQSANTQWELLYSRQDSAADTTGIFGLSSSTDVEVQNLHLGGTYQGEGQSVRPYLVATIGGTRFAPDTTGLDSDTFWSFTIGTGVQFRPKDRLGIRLEARAWGTLIESESNLFCISGADSDTCGISIAGRMFWQFEVFAGVVFRF